MSFNLCIIIPIYNHGEQIRATIDSLRTSLYLPIFIVDDGSDKATQAVLNMLVIDKPDITLLRLPSNKGKGFAVMLGFVKAYDAGFSHAIQVDADGQHDIKALPRLMQDAEVHPFALISGVPRYDNSIPKARLYGRYITHFWVWVETLSFDIKDSMCGFRVYPLVSTVALVKESSIGTYMDFDTDIIVRLYWRGVKIREHTVCVIYPDDGRSNFRPLKDNLLISWMHMRLVFGMLWRIPLLLKRKFRV